MTIQHSGRPGARQRKRVQNSGHRRRGLAARRGPASGWSARDSRQHHGGSDCAHLRLIPAVASGPSDLPQRRRQDGHLRGRSRDHRLGRHARPASRGAGAAARGRLRGDGARPRDDPARARGEGPRHRAGDDRGLRPRRRAGHVPRPVQQLLRHRLGPDEHLRPRDRRAPAERAGRRRARRAALRRAAQHRLRHVVRAPQRHRAAALLPGELQGDGREHDQADGHDLRARRRPGCDVRDRRRRCAAGRKSWPPSRTSPCTSSR